MKIKWYGQSCFLLTSDNGTRILTDPVGKIPGYRLPEMGADIVTVSHNHSDHNNIKVVKGDFVHLDQPVKCTKKGMGITGVATFHDKAGGTKRGKNIIFSFNIDGINVCHCGDLGHVLTGEQVREIGKVDVLLVPVGGRFTINAADAVEVMKQLRPAVTVPMHYRTKALGLLGLFFGTDKDFIACSGLKAEERRELVLDKGSLEEEPKIITLKYD